MRKTVLITSVSLDCYMEGPNRELDWPLVDDELHTHFNDLLRGVWEPSSKGASPTS